ncbi:MAG TPA: indole-3-glycerol phosphate synthase TrpC [Flavobacteriales bacterium]|nr:indole-3-glycerol phosphate synthase TrpC [Flavobacteriales bacterium]
MREKGKNILDEIIKSKRKEVEEQKSLYPKKLLEKSVYFASDSVSLKTYLKRDDLVGIIAEIKRKSPSQGIINEYADIEKTSIGYMQAGASALSILTDTEYFGGSKDDLSIARKFNYCPILRKDFVIDEYQVVEAKSIGADAILLIAAVLEVNEAKELARFSKSLGLEVLLEVRDENEIAQYIDESIDIVGVNNRNLQSFEVTVETSMSLAERIPKNITKISESGISDPSTIIDLKHCGYDGFLIGEYFMQTSRPHITCSDFIKKLKELS